MRAPRQVLYCMVMVVFATAGVATAHTWRVERDGTGDFTDIQPAVEVAAPGDTIMIGPGRYNQFHPCVAPAWTEEATGRLLRQAYGWMEASLGIAGLRLAGMVLD